MFFSNSTLIMAMLKFAGYTNYWQEQKAEYFIKNHFRCCEESKHYIFNKNKIRLWDWAFVQNNNIQPQIRYCGSYKKRVWIKMWLNESIGEHSTYFGNLFGRRT